MERRVDDGSTSMDHDDDAKENMRDIIQQAVTASVHTVQQAVNSSVDAAFEKQAKERARLSAEAELAAEKVKQDAESAAARVTATGEEVSRLAREESAKLEEEKAAMQNTHTFQNNIILLDVGGHKFTTSLQTLTSVPGTYFASLISGRFELTLNAEGAYFIDRDGSHFRHILNFMREPVEEGYTLSSDVTEGHRGELTKELEFYGLLDRMLPMPSPFRVQDIIGQSLLQRACVNGSKLWVQAAVSQSRALVFEIGTTTPFLTDEFQDLRFVITECVVYGWPVWAAVGGKWFLFHYATSGRWVISDDSTCAADPNRWCIYNTSPNDNGVAPTEMPSNQWVCKPSAALPSQYASARRYVSGCKFVPTMRIKAVHGLGDDDPAMAEALQKLAALA
jgi:hypothetical protein